MDFLHTDPATGDQYSLSVDDGGGMPSFAERQAAVAQYRAATQGAGTQVNAGYGYAPLNAGGATALATSAGAGYGQDFWSPSAWVGSGDGGYSLGVPQPYSGDPNQSPAAQMLRARGVSPEALPPPPTAGPTPIVARAPISDTSNGSPSDPLPSDPFSWRSWLLGKDGEPEDAPVPQSGVPSWVDWLEQGEGQADEDDSETGAEADPAAGASGASEQTPPVAVAPATATQPIATGQAGSDTNGDTPEIQKAQAYYRARLHDPAAFHQYQLDVARTGQGDGTSTVFDPTAPGATDPNTLFTMTVADDPTSGYRIRLVPLPGGQTSVKVETFGAKGDALFYQEYPAWQQGEASDKYLTHTYISPEQQMLQDGVTRGQASPVSLPTPNDVASLQAGTPLTVQGDSADQITQARLAAGTSFVGQDRRLPLIGREVSGQAVSGTTDIAAPSGTLVWNSPSSASSDNTGTTAGRGTAPMLGVLPSTAQSAATQPSQNAPRSSQPTSPTGPFVAPVISDDAMAKYAAQFLTPESLQYDAAPSHKLSELVNSPPSQWDRQLIGYTPVGSATLKAFAQAEQGGNQKRLNDLNAKVNAEIDALENSSIGENLSYGIFSGMNDAAYLTMRVPTSVTLHRETIDRAASMVGNGLSSVGQGNGWQTPSFADTGANGLFSQTVRDQSNRPGFMNAVGSGAANMLGRPSGWEDMTAMGMVAGPLGKVGNLALNTAMAAPAVGDVIDRWRKGDRAGALGAGVVAASPYAFHAALKLGQAPTEGYLPDGRRVRVVRTIDTPKGAHTILDVAGERRLLRKAAMRQVDVSPKLSTHQALEVVAPEEPTSSETKSGVVFAKQPRFGGKAVTKTMLAAANLKLAAYGMKIARDADQLLDERFGGAAGAFHPESKRLYLRSDATYYLLFHEMAHFQHYTEIGLDAFLELSNTRAGKAVLEQYVYDKVMSNRDQFTQK